MKKNEIMDVVFLLDRSGSMSGIESDTIGGYNGYLESMKEKNAKITTVLFDDRYELLIDREDIKNVKKLNNETYFTRGSTALLDAVGKTIKHMDELKAKKVLFIITTDGLENASREYNKGQIKELIEGHSNWEFVFLGANIDSYQEATSIGIKKNRTSNYSKTNTRGMFDNLKELSVMFEADFIRDDWKDGLEDYINDNKE